MEKESRKPAGAHDAISRKQHHLASEIAASIKRSSEASEIRIHRQTHVLNEYMLYVQACQLDLVQSAIYWTFASLAANDRRKDCESIFYSIIDLLYTSTDDARHTLDESERQQIVVAATTVRDHLLKDLDAILRASIEDLKAHDKEHPFRLTAEMLHQVLVTFMAYSPETHLRDLVMACICFCSVNELHELGISESSQEVEQNCLRVAEYAQKAITAVHDEIKAGRLVVKDGKIVDPLLEAERKKSNSDENNFDDEERFLHGEALKRIASEECMGEPNVRTFVEDVFAFRNRLETVDESAIELELLGMTIEDVKADPYLLFEAGIARNIRRACDAIGMAVSPHQSLTLAKHMCVGKDRYRNGVPLTHQERAIAIRLKRIHLETECEKKGVPFTEEIARDCGRSVRFGERGLTVGHRIGEASGCFQVVLFGLSVTSFALAVVLLSSG